MIKRKIDGKEEWKEKDRVMDKTTCARQRLAYGIIIAINQLPSYFLQGCQTSAWEISLLQL